MVVNNCVRPEIGHRAIATELTARAGPPRQVSRIAFVLLLLTVACTSAAQTGAIAFLPVMIGRDASPSALLNHGFHVAGLSASFPLAALLLAPLWGWMADRSDYRFMLRTALFGVAASTALFGITGLGMLYVVRAAAGMASAAVIPVSLLAAGLWAKDRKDRAWRFTWLTASMFLGDLAGPLLAEASASIEPRAPLAFVAVGIAILALGLCVVQLPVRRPECPADGHMLSMDSRTTFTLLAMTVLAGAGLSALHVSLLLIERYPPLDRATIAWILTLCGVGMLAAQLVQARTPWLVSMPRRLARFMLAALAFAVVASTYVDQLIALAAVVIMVGWSAASLRLITSFWIFDRASGVSGKRLGLQHAATSIGQASAPIGIAAVSADSQWMVAGAIATGALSIALGLSFLWSDASGRTL